MAKKSVRSKVIRTPKARLSFPNLIEPRSFEGSEPKYSCVLIFEEGTDLSELRSAVNEVAMDYFEGKRPENFRSPFRKCEEKAHMDGYEPGGTFVSASSKRRPGVVGPDAKTRLEDPTDIYPGCYVRATVVAFTYDTRGNKGVSFGLNNVQKVGEGEPLGSFTRAEDDFDEVEGWDEDGEDIAPGDGEGMFA